MNSSQEPERDTPNLNTIGDGSSERPATSSLFNRLPQKVTSRKKRKCKRERKTQPDSHSPPALQADPNITTLDRLPPKSRNKRRCHFGPQKKRGRSKERREQGKQSRSPPVRPPQRRWDASSNWLLEDIYSEELEEPPILSARTTLAPPTYKQRTPFDHYKAGPAPAPYEDPYRFIHRKLGISALTF